MKINLWVSLVVCAAVFTMTGCAKKLEPMETTEGMSENMTPMTTTTSSGIGLSPIFPGTANLSPEDQARLDVRVFYFDFNSNEVREDYFQNIRAHALNLAANPTVHIRVEGHTDERGSREYNIALGERRAQAVLNILLMEGANRDQISVVSYGAEKAAVPGQDESAWQYNRRATVVYEAG